jgi:hypothetical protein
MIVEPADQEKFKPFFDLFKLLKQELGSVSYNYWLAGGAITSHLTDSPINDFDFYSNDPKQFIQDLKLITPVVNKNPYSYDFMLDGNKLQVTDYPYRDPIRTLYNYDYTICCIAFDGNNIYYAEEFWDDIHSKTLQFRKNNIHPLTAFERLIKYAKRGFNPTAETMLRVAKDLSQRYGYAWDKITTDHFRNY